MLLDMQGKRIPCLIGLQATTDIHKPAIPREKDNWRKASMNGIDSISPVTRAKSTYLLVINNYKHKMSSNPTYSASQFNNTDISWMRLPIYRNRGH